MEKLPDFEKLVAIEAAVRMESIYRRQYVVLDEKENSHDHYIPDLHEKRALKKAVAEIDGKILRRVTYDVKNPDTGTTRDEVAGNLYNTFLDIYNFVFQDSSQHHKFVGGDACNTADLKPEDLKKLKAIFSDFAGKFYDFDSGEKGHLKSSLREGDAGPNALQNLYEAIQSLPLHNSALASGALFVQMGRSDKWKEVFPLSPVEDPYREEKGGKFRYVPDVIDFTRGEPTDNISERFKNAFDTTKIHHNDPGKTFIPPPEHLEEIGGLHFPVVTLGWQKHLVTRSGHLVNLTKELRSSLKEHLDAGKPLDTFHKLKIDETLHLRNFDLKGYNDLATPHEGAFKNGTVDELYRRMEHLRDANVIDGLPVKDASGNRIPFLMASDIDIMTGLNLQELAAFKKLMGQKDGRDRSWSDLVPEGFNKNILAMTAPKQREEARAQLAHYVREEMEKLKARTHGDKTLEDILTRAGERLQVTIPNVYEASDQAFLRRENGKGTRELIVPAGRDKKFYMSMGGTATGKGGLTKIAKEECGKDLAIASFDDARALADQYCLYAATNNHNDDYRATFEFGDAVRELVTRRAREGEYNLFLDGSGIPYEDRFDKTTKLFKKDGYNVFVLAAQAPLFINDPELRQQVEKEGLVLDEASIRLGWRLLTEMRGLPMSKVLDKHIGFALASRNAARDPNVDRFIVQDVAPPQNDSYTLSYIATVGKKQMERLSGIKGEKLQQIIKKASTENSDSLLTPPWIKLPDDDERGKFYSLKVIRDNGDDTYRIEIITDIKQYMGMVEKGIFNRKATSFSSCFDNCIHGDVEGHFQNVGGKVITEPPKGYTKRSYPHPTADKSIAEWVQSTPTTKARADFSIV